MESIKTNNLNSTYSAPYLNLQDNKKKSKESSRLRIAKITGVSVAALATLLAGYKLLNKKAIQNNNSQDIKRCVEQPIKKIIKSVETKIDSSEKLIGKTVYKTAPRPIPAPGIIENITTKDGDFAVKSARSAIACGSIEFIKESQSNALKLNYKDESTYSIPCGSALKSFGQIIARRITNYDSLGRKRVTLIKYLPYVNSSKIIGISQSVDGKIVKNMGCYSGM